MRKIKVENKFIQNENLCEHIFILILLQCEIIKIKYLEKKYINNKKNEKKFFIEFFWQFSNYKKENEKEKLRRKTVLNKFIFSYAFILEEVVV